MNKTNQAMSLLKEFKTFALKGNAIDMAIGIIIGAAFGKIVTSLVNDVIMPPIGLVVGGVDFSDLSLTLKKAAGTRPAVSINYGQFLNQVIDFSIIAFCIFLVVKGMNTLKKEKLAESDTKKCPECLMDIPKAAKRCGHCTSVLKLP